MELKEMTHPYITKCLELSERATKGWSTSLRAGGQPVYGLLPWGAEGIASLFKYREDAEFIAHARTALPKVCEALKICMKAFDDIDEQKQLAGVHDNLTALAFASRLALCQIAKDGALQKLSKLFDDADVSK